MRINQINQIIGGGAALVALALALAAVSQPAEAQTTLPACTVTQAGEGGTPAAVPCTRTIPGTGTVSAVWKSGGTKTLASDSPSVSGRVVTFTPSDRDADSEDDTGSAVYEIVVTDNGIALNRYTITVTTYAADQAPSTTPEATPSLEVVFVGESDGVVPAGTNVQLKVTGKNGALVNSAEVPGLNFDMVRTESVPDDYLDRDRSRSITTADHDKDSDPDIRVLRVPLGALIDGYSQTYFRNSEYPYRAATAYWIYQALAETCFRVNYGSTSSDSSSGSNGYAYVGKGCTADNVLPGAVSDTTGTNVISIEIVVPSGTPAGDYPVTVKGQRGALDTTPITVTKVLTVSPTANQVGTVSFGPSSPRKAMAGDTDTTPKDGYVDDATTAEPTTIMAGTGTTELSLSVLSGSNQPSEASAVSSIVVTTTGGTLSTQSIGAMGSETAQAANCKTQNSAACELDLSSLRASGDQLPAKMRIELKAPASPGTATVTATVISGGQVHRPDPVQVRFSGPATSLSIGAAPSNVLGYNVGNDQAADYNAATKADSGTDARDQISFMLDATDASGSAVTVPTVTAMLKTSGGALVAQSKYETTQSGSMMSSLMLDIDAAITSALAAGTYTLEVTSGTLKASTTLMVVGAADEVDLTLDPVPATEIGQGVTASVMVTDAGGNAVADGTMVAFGVSDLVGDDDAVAVLDDTSALTVAGKATTTLTVVGAGRAVVRATVSDDSTPARDVEVLISTAGAPAAPAAEASLDCLSALSGFATWTCDVESTASEVFGLVSGRGASAVHLWNGSAWVRYSVVDGTMVPGSSDFTVGRSDILYISN